LARVLTIASERMTLLEAAVAVAGVDAAMYEKLLTDLGFEKLSVRLLFNAETWAVMVTTARARGAGAELKMTVFRALCKDATDYAPPLEKPAEFLAQLAEKFPFAPDRFTMPAMLNESPFFGTTAFRRKQFADVLGVWQRSADKNLRQVSFREPLPYVPSSPGSGKTHLAAVLAARGIPVGSSPFLVVVEGTDVTADVKIELRADSEFEAALTECSADFARDVREAVGVTVTFNHWTRVADQEPSTVSSALGMRMVFSHFIRGPQTMFDSFLAHLVAAGCVELGPEAALHLIVHDIAQNYPLPTGHPRQAIGRCVIVVVDELLKSRDADGVVQAVSSLMGARISKGRLMPFVTSLSAAAVQRGASASQRVLFAVLLQAFPPECVDDFVSKVADVEVRKRLESQPYQSLLRDCAGVPRLVEMIFKAALAPEIVGYEKGHVLQSLRELVQFGAQYAVDAVLASLLVERVDVAKFAPLREELVKNGCFHPLYVAESDAENWGVPPLLMWLWSKWASTASDCLLRAVGEFLGVERDTAEEYESVAFEKQIAALWKMCDIADWMWRTSSRPWLESPCVRRSIYGILRVDRDLVLKRQLREDGSYHRALEELDPLTYGPAIATEANSDELKSYLTGEALGVVRFANRTEPGIDVLITNRLKTSAATRGENGVHFTGLQARFGGLDTASQTSPTEAFVNTVLYSRVLAQALIDNRFCFVLMSFQVVTGGSLDDICKDIVGALQRLFGPVSRRKDGATAEKTEGGLKKRRSKRTAARDENADLLSQITVEMVRRSVIVLRRRDVERLLSPSLQSRSQYLHRTAGVKEKMRDKQAAKAKQK
jgi:hypothetical protein